MIVAIPKHGKLGEGFSKRDILDSYIHPGRRTQIKGYQSPAAWISDLIALKKVIILCSFCQHPFNHRKHGYRKMYVPDYTGKSDGYTVNGQCDACKQQTANCGGGAAFIFEESYRLLCADPSEARRKARAMAGAKSVWAFINAGK